MQSEALASAINPDNYRMLQEQVYTNTGIVLEGDKRYLFQNRLGPIVRQLGLDSIDDLCVLMFSKRDREVGRKVMEAMTTNETYFFRDPAQYDAIRTSLLPRMKQERGTHKLCFWSAAASTGQEAYSLAMLLLQEALDGWDLQILATDFSSQVLDRARSGTYQQIEVNRGLPASLLVKYFRRAGVDWQLCDKVRQMVRFQSMDLRQKMRTLGPFDLVFCRNVLIYFDNATRRSILKELHQTLFRGGWLLLGGSEAGLGVDEWFERQTVGSGTVYVAR